MTSAARLRRSPVRAAGARGFLSAVPSLDSAVARIGAAATPRDGCRSAFELDALDERASTTPDRMLATAPCVPRARSAGVGMIRLGQKLIDSGERDARAFRLAYPLLDGDELARDARAHGLDPALVAG